MVKLKERAAATALRQIAGVKVQVWESGEGPPILYLHPGDGFNAEPVLESLSDSHHVIAPSHPGFDGSELPEDFRTVDDLAYWYLDLLEELDLTDVLLLGVSFGAWIAAEIAIKSTARLSGLVLVDAVGARFSSAPREREIADLFSIPQWELPQLLYHGDALRRPDFGALPHERLVQLARNHESFCLYGWSPTLNDPKLVRRLHRIDVPTAVIWGRHDRVVSVNYGQRLAEAIPGASFTVIEDAGHYPHVEQPASFLRAIDALPVRTHVAANRI